MVLQASWHKISPSQNENHAVHELPQPSRKPRTTTRIGEEKGYFELSEEDVKVLTQWDEVFRASPEFEKHRNVWVPLSIRLAHWTIEARQRNSTRKIEMFYHHPNSPCRLRSKKQALEFIHYGFVPNIQKGSSSWIPDNSFPPCSQRERTQKEEVEAFLAGTNFMNLGSHENQDGNSLPPCPKRQRTHKEEVEMFLAEAWKNLMNLGSNEN